MEKYVKSYSDSDHVANTKSHNALHTLTHNLCRNFERQIANNIGGKNPKCFWSYVKSRVKTCMNIGSIEGMDSQLHHSDCTKANAFNNLFSSVFIHEDSNTVPTFITGRDDLTILSCITVTPAIVCDKLHSLKSNKSRPDGCIWPPFILRNCTEHLCVPLSMLFNRSLETGLLPKDWKIGHITPILKKGSKVKVNNYHPVCLTSVIIKLLESIVKDVLLSHLYHYNLLSDQQHGFLPHRSC